MRYQQRTNAHKACTVTWWLAEFPELSDREIARRSGVSPQTANNWRKRIADLMTERNFPCETISRNGRSAAAFRIECAKCGKKAYFSETTGRRPAPGGARSFFRKNGWTIGNGPRADFCRDCSQPDRKMKQEANLATTGEVKKAETPREMTRDERLIIMDKIRDVNDGERYTMPWNDKAVAEDLGVPWAWVKDIRENVLLFQDQVSANVGRFDEEMKAIKTEIDENRQKITSLSAENAALKVRVENLVALSKKVERELAGR